MLSNLCDKNFPDVDNLTLLKKTKEIVKELQVNKKQHALVVERTRDRANSKLKFRMRTACITASKFKNASHTDSSCTLHSLIMGMHPEMARFDAQADT